MHDPDPEYMIHDAKLNVFNHYGIGKYKDNHGRNDREAAMELIRNVNNSLLSMHSQTLTAKKFLDKSFYYCIIFNIVFMRKEFAN